jgi:hypothetical protein
MNGNEDQLAFRMNKIHRGVRKIRSQSETPKLQEIIGLLEIRLQVRKVA